MQTYQISTKHGSAKRHVEFFSSPKDADFRSACEAAFRPFGFESEFDGHYFYMGHPDKNSTMRKLSIESDEWGFVWGEAYPWGTTEENAEGIELFELILKNSNQFRAR
jgi:hypothetical protein